MRILARIGIVLIILLHLEQCFGLMCYFCQDTSSKDKKNACRTWVRTMNYYRRQYNKKGTYTTDKYVKNCTNYANEPDDNVYCMIATIESRGELRSFIRDCSNGKNFFSEDIDKNIRARVATQGDNQTHVEQLGLNGTATVTLCRDGHFCNGPVSDAGHNNLSVVSMLLVLVTYYLYWWTY